MDKMKFESPSLTEKNIDKIAELFPSVITESTDESGNLKKSINFEKLRQLLSEDVAEGDETYEFTWVGKRAAIADRLTSLSARLCARVPRRAWIGTLPKICILRAIILRF